jgi:adenosylcobinamide-GDP ribazoletransferase
MTRQESTGAALGAGRGGAARDAFAFLTPIARSNRSPSPEAMAFFPVVGAVLGLIEGIAWRGARRFWATLPAAAIVIGADAVLTGALHLDGLADTADGLLAHVPTKDRLEIMAEPEVGTFGTVALVISLVARAAAMSSIEPSPTLLAALGCCSRSVMVLGSRSLPYARETGLVTPFLAAQEVPDPAVRAAVCGLVGAALVTGLAHDRRGLMGVFAGSAAGAAVLLGARRRLGGFTGDVLGASGVVCETVGLLVSARR